MTVRYSLRDIFLLTMFIAVAVAAFQGSDYLDQQGGRLAATASGLASVGAVGAAIGTLFHRKMVWAAMFVGVPVGFWIIVFLSGRLLGQ